MNKYLNDIMNAQTPEEMKRVGLASMRGDYSPESEIAALEAQLAEARAVLKRIEEDNYNCPWPECPGERGLVPHAPECRLAKALSG